MSNTLKIIAILICLLILGFIRIINRILYLQKRIDFTSQYLKRYSEFISKDNFDEEEYYWLTYNVNKIQAELGVGGIIDYRPPFANYIINNYQLIINTLPEIRSGIAHEAMINACSEVMIRHLGLLDKNITELRNQLYNPFIYLREGINLIITLPIRIAYWSGLVEYSSFEKVSTGIIVKIFSFLIMILGVIASVITIFIGWEPFITQMRLLYQ